MEATHTFFQVSCSFGHAGPFAEQANRRHRRIESPPCLVKDLLGAEFMAISGRDSRFSRLLRAASVREDLPTGRPCPTIGADFRAHRQMAASPSMAVSTAMFTASQRTFLLTIATMAFLVTSINAADAQRSPTAQQGEEIIDQTGDEQEEEDQPESAFGTFDDVRIERVRPHEIPDFRPGLPRGARTSTNSDDLPRSLTGDQLTRVSDQVAAATVEIIVIQRPPRPYRQTDMVYRGHGIWISPHEDGADPILVATSDWLEGAEAVYAVRGEASQALSRGGVALGGHRPQPLADVMADRSNLLERHRENLVELEVAHANRHVNLARLVPKRDEAEDELEPPPQGLTIHPMDRILPVSIFAYSPSVSDRVTQIAYQNSQDLDPAYSFYFLVTFRAILGAPVVTGEGRLLAMTALRYPDDPKYSLAIPPGAIHAFVESQTAGRD